VTDNTPPPTALLHNMSAPSKSVISHTGQSIGGRLSFWLPSGSTPRDLLASVGGDVAGLRARDVERELVARINAHAQTLPLPLAAAVASYGEEGQVTEACQDQLTIITVLAKSSDRVYLRDKEPILPILSKGRRVVLIVPTGWSPA
jgi:hypothetical protein